MEKKYDYDKIISLTSSGSSLDSAFTELQDKLVEMHAKIVELQESFHGKDTYSDLYKVYDKILSTNIGKASKIGSFWWTCNNIYSLCCTINNNAVRDREFDTEN